MAITTFTVTNLNPDFEALSGFWFDPQNSSGDKTGITTQDSRGTWVWVDGQSFDIDGSSGIDGTAASAMLNALEDECFGWKPKNPDYNTVAPFLKDGTTANPAFDNSGNPLLMDGSTKASVVGDICKHFDVATAVA